LTALAFALAFTGAAVDGFDRFAAADPAVARFVFGAGLIAPAAVRRVSGDVHALAAAAPVSGATLVGATAGAAERGAADTGGAGFAFVAEVVAAAAVLGARR
jgi:hypothetical protein